MVGKIHLIWIDEWNLRSLFRYCFSQPPLPVTQLPGTKRDMRLLWSSLLSCRKLGWQCLRSQTSWMFQVQQWPIGKRNHWSLSPQMEKMTENEITDGWHDQTKRDQVNRRPGVPLAHANSRSSWPTQKGLPVPYTPPSGRLVKSCIPNLVQFLWSRQKLKKLIN
jgi:hypothetical protein